MAQVTQPGLLASIGRAATTAVLGSDLASEEGRSFLQQRLALFASTAMLISSLFLVVDLAVVLLGQWESWGDVWLRNAAHLAGIVVALVGWLLARRGQWSLRGLVALDLLVTLLSLVAYGAMLLTTGGDYAARVDAVMNLITIVFLMFRAVLVPATPQHTGAVSLLGMLPALAVGHYSASVNEGQPGLPPLWIVDLFALIWTIAVVTMTTLIAQTIYRLRAKIWATRRLGQYLLGDKIGEGGMGAVYHAQHALLRRPTALKLILPERVGRQAIVRFEREVQLTALLTHPNTVSVFDFGHTPDGIFYYAMEYLAGIDLEHLVRQFGRLPAERVVHVLKQVAGALAEAHDRGLVHRDVKPANIILCERGGLLDTAKIVDFGLVKDLSVPANPALSNVNTVIGTPLYLAPEAIVSPDNVDGRADLYALGAVGYFLLTATPVFSGTSAIDVCAQHLHSLPEPPSTRVGVSLPSGLESVLLRCLAKKPEQRPQTAAALAEELGQVQVAGWTQQQARVWWQEHEPLIERRRQSHRPRAVGSAVTIDVEARAFQRPLNDRA